MSMLNYDFKYVEGKRNGYHKRQVFNSVLPSTYEERYHFAKENFPLKGITVLGLLGALAFLALYFGFLDWMKPIFI